MCTSYCRWKHRITSRLALSLFGLVTCLSLSACNPTTGPAGPSAGTPDHPASHDQEGPEPEGVVHLEPEMLESIELRTEPAVARVLPAQLQTTGKVDFQQDRLAHVSSRIDGRVEAVRADLGDTIEAGQPLAILDSIALGEAKSAFLQSKAHEDLQRQDYERVRGLFDEEIASEQQLQTARAAHLEAIAQLQSSRGTLRLYGLSDRSINRLNYDDRPSSLHSITSPIAGRVIDKHVTIGEQVTPARILFSIADLSRVWIWIDVYEGDLAKVHLEDDVSVTVESYEGEDFEGRVTYISDQVDSATRTVRARIDVENPNRRLKPGMFARVVLSDPHSDLSVSETSTVIPFAAIQRDGDHFVVFIALDEGRFERREVATGRRASGFVEILDGIDVGNQVVVEGAFLLKSEASKESMGGGHDH